MSKLSSGLRRVDRPSRSVATSWPTPLLPKRIALPVFMSSVVAEIFLVLSVAGLVGLRDVALDRRGRRLRDAGRGRLYRQNARLSSGGGDYEVVTTNLGPTAGLTVASADGGLRPHRCGLDRVDSAYIARRCRSSPSTRWSSASWRSCC